jgi:hypothetical protein
MKLSASGNGITVLKVRKMPGVRDAASSRHPQSGTNRYAVQQLKVPRVSCSERAQGITEPSHVIEITART